MKAGRRSPGQPEGTHLPVAKMSSWWGLLCTLHTPMECLWAKVRGLSRRLRRVPTPGECPQRRQGALVLHAQGWPLGNSPLASEHTRARRPGVPAFQKPVVPTCAETERPADHSNDNRTQPLPPREDTEAMGDPVVLEAGRQKSPVLELCLQTWRGPPWGRQERLRSLA